MVAICIYRKLLLLLDCTTHLNQTTGLSRYFDLGEDQPQSTSERDQTGRTHYDRVREYYRTQSRCL